MLQGCLNPLGDAIFPSEVHLGLRRPTGNDLPEQGSPLKADFLLMYIFTSLCTSSNISCYAMKHDYCDCMQISNMNNTIDQ